MAGLISALHRMRWGRKLAVAWLLGIALLAALAPLLPLPYAPSVPDLLHTTEGPTATTRHWLGTDPQGRDVLSGLVFGARTAILLTLPAALLAALLGGAAGGAAGFWGNRLRLGIAGWVATVAILSGWLCSSWPVTFIGTGLAATLAVGLQALRRRATVPIPLDSLVLAAATGLDTVPRLILVLALAARGGLTPMGLGLVLGLTSWAGPARLVRARMLTVRVLPFVEAAQATGLSPVRVWWHHALPHALQPLRAAVPLSIAGLLALESTLSFLGVGLPPETASWGQQLAAARMAPQAWWAIIFPTAVLTITILSAQTLSPRHKQFASNTQRKG